jgi:hypothetical protein
MEKPYGWYFMYQSNEWLRTRDRRHLLVGSGGFIVEREDGRTYEFGSAYGQDRNFAAYEYGLKYKIYDLIVNQVQDFERTIELLLTLNLTYVIAEFEYGRQWRIPRAYDKILLAKKLQVLPCTFENCRGFYFKYEQFLEIDREQCFDYQLKGHCDTQP